MFFSGFVCARVSVANGTFFVSYTYFSQTPFSYLNGKIYVLDKLYYVRDYDDYSRPSLIFGKWNVFSREDINSNGYGETLDFAIEHPELFSCRALHNIKYKLSETLTIVDPRADPSSPVKPTVQALLLGGCIYSVEYNDCPDDVLSTDNFCTATSLDLLRENSDDEDEDKPPSDGSEDSSSSDDSGDSGSSSGDTSSGSGSGSSSGGGSGGSEPVPGPSVDITHPGHPGPSSGDSGESDGDAGDGSDFPSVDDADVCAPFGIGCITSSGQCPQGMTHEPESLVCFPDPDFYSGGSGGGSGGASGSGDGSGTYPGGNPSGGHSGASTGATGDDDDGSNIFLPSLDIPELSLSPLWNMWPSARDFTLNLPDAQCPVFNIEVFGLNYRIDAFCTLLTPDVIAVLRLICILAASVFSFIIVLRS